MAAGAHGATPLASRTSTSQPIGTKGPQASVLVRTGDPVPVEARVGRINSLATLPDGRLAFVMDYAALMLRESGAARILVHIGDDMPGCGNVTEIFDVAAGADGSLAIRLVCDYSLAVARIDPAGGAHEVVLRIGMSFPGLTYPIGYLYGPVIDGQGRVIAIVGSTPDSAAIVRQAKGGAPEVVLKSGDPIGTAQFREAVFYVTVNSAGTIAFRARITGDQEAIVTFLPGSAPEIVIAAPQLAAPPSFEFQFGPPAINDDGVVAFLRGVHRDEHGYFDDFEVLRARDGVVETIVAAGDPAPGGRTFGAIAAVGPSIEASGAVLFGAHIPATAGNSGLYRFDGISTVLVEPGETLPDGSVLSGPGGAIPLPDGSVQFMGARYVLAPFEYLGSALFVERDGALTIEMKEGEPLAEPARIVELARGGYPFRHLASGPFMASDGAVIFDATVTGRERGLYARGADGTLTAVAVGGGPAPGGGPFYAPSFAFHSIAAGGRVAFLGSTDWRGPREYAMQLFTGFAVGPLASILVEGDTIDGFDAPIAELLPPSRVRPDGAIVVPVVLGDGSSLLLRWNGAAFDVLARTGDVLPGGDTIEAIRTGHADALLAPLLADDGAVIFGVVTSSGDDALYRLPPTGGIASATRVLGDGAPVEGNILDPFLLRAMSVDATGRLAFQAVTNPEDRVATYLAEEGALPARVAGPGDGMANGVVVEALPRLAATASGIVHETTMTQFSTQRVLWLAVPRAAIGNTPAFDQLPLNLGGTPAPDGGTFRGGGVVLGPAPPSPPISLNRVGSDGERFVVSIEETLQGAQILTLFDLRPEGVLPIAAAGADLVVECAGPLGTLITLDGSASTDPGQGALIYAWSTPSGTATGPSPSIVMPLGTWTVYLKVTNAQGLSSEDSLTVTVQDTIAPTVTVGALPSLIWPPDGRFVPVQFAVTMNDACDPALQARLISVAVDGSTRTAAAGDVAGADYGTDDRTILLRARRSGRGGARTYTAAYQVRDRSGNFGIGTATVTVPRRPPARGPGVPPG